jgi:hypothetical protein
VSDDHITFTKREAIEIAAAIEVARDRLASTDLDLDFVLDGIVRVITRKIFE